MRTRPACLASILAAAGALGAIALAPSAAADEPSCTDVAGTSECSTPGNVEINASPNVVDDPTIFPFWDEIYGDGIYGGAYTGGPYAVPYDEGAGIR